MAATVTSVTKRSAISRGKLFPESAHVDKRSVASRRFRDLLEDYEMLARENSKGSLTAAGKVLVRRAAHLTVRLEEMEERYMRGEADDVANYSAEHTKACGALSRLLRQLGISTTQRSFRKDETLESYVTKTYPKIKRREEED